MLGILVAAAFGSGDFLGGRASRGSPALSVLAVSQATAVGGALVATLLVGAHVGARDLVFGALAGSVNVVGLGLLYRGLATGPMGVVAPLTAVVGAVVPVAWGRAHGEQPSGLVIIGVVCAIGAAGLIGVEPRRGGARVSAVGATWALGAGVGLGASLIFLSEPSPRSGLWPVLAARLAALVLIGRAMRRRARPAQPRHQWYLAGPDACDDQRSSTSSGTEAAR